jgi:hypothetical protein
MRVGLDTVIFANVYIIPEPQIAFRGSADCQGKIRKMITMELVFRSVELNFRLFVVRGRV